ncbi:hypothetical protein JCM19274_1105 [Algibacter lectus]|uniref:Uncharacterized protein n=1 Tax=Algibacter lectus TaxID=221126 RepID=A0A090WNQ2_9FLAO|nr:hypothetical protein [Algibacter lectus]GAL78641.1 hypothetical protein JCM19274_1105 [Algibacter lectus]
MKRRTFIETSIKGSLALSSVGLLSCMNENKPPEAFIDRVLPAPIGGGFRDDNYWIWGVVCYKRRRW